VPLNETKGRRKGRKRLVQVIERITAHARDPEKRGYKLRPGGKKKGTILGESTFTRPAEVRGRKKRGREDCKKTDPLRRTASEPRKDPGGRGGGERSESVPRKKRFFGWQKKKTKSGEREG